jgi:hypothetical protein
MSPGRAGKLRHPVMVGLLKSMIIGMTEAPREPEIELLAFDVLT